MRMWCRYAQPPANGLDPFGIPEGLQYHLGQSGCCIVKASDMSPPFKGWHPSRDAIEMMIKTGGGAALTTG